MLKPYYSRQGIEIYHGDCISIIPRLDRKFDLVLTDPPYNYGKDYGIYKDNLLPEEYEKTMMKIINQCRSIALNQFWVAPRYQLPLWSKLIPDYHLIIIPRGASGPFRQGWSDQFEIALAVGKPSQCIPDLWKNIRLKGEGYFFREDTNGHPGYTPYLIMERAAKVLSNISLCDPFCGTGTSLIAAVKLKRQAVGIEIEEKYCEISVKRIERILNQGTLDLEVMK